MTQKTVINEHFSKTAAVWRDKIYKSKAKQRFFEYFDKQYRFDYTVGMVPKTASGQRALDMGCGAGQLIPILTELGYQVSAIDISENMVELTKKLCREYNVNTEAKVGDCENLDYPDNSFDVYVAMGVIEYMDTDEVMLSEVKRMLRPGGIAIITIRSKLSIHVKWRTFYRKYIEYPIKNFIKKIFGKEITPYRAISREHYPDQLREKLEAMSFKFLDERYAHFHTLFEPFQRLLPFIEAICGKWMEKHSSKGKFRLLASSYIIKVQKNVENSENDS